MLIVNVMEKMANWILQDRGCCEYQSDLNAIGMMVAYACMSICLCVSVLY